jgi:hypothetical protein
MKLGSEPLRIVGQMSFTITVPEEVPSLRHSSEPRMPSSAEKRRLSPTILTWEIAEPFSPGRMSFTSITPPSVRWYLHSSGPCVPPFASKKT